ncbi:hypothetical protein [Flagellimonas pacifica]|nr:hypothetical protein [Allomuricauda parva]
MKKLVLTLALAKSYLVVRKSITEIIAYNLRKTVSLSLKLLILLILLSCSGLKNKMELEGTDRIPKTAFLVEKDGIKTWFDIEWINNHRNMTRISIYDGNNGNLISKGRFIKICPVQKLQHIGELKNEIDFYDGKNIQLKGDCYLLKN